MSVWALLDEGALFHASSPLVSDELGRFIYPVVVGVRSLCMAEENNEPLVGQELLRKIAENKGLDELDLMRSCGYVLSDKDGKDEQDFAAWWEAVLVAKGAPPNADFRKYWEPDVQAKLRTKQEKENQPPLGVLPSPLEGQDLLDKIEELGDMRRIDIVRRCGYVSKKEDGSYRVQFSAFYDAHAKAQGLITDEESFTPEDLLKITNADWNDYTEVIEDMRERNSTIDLSARDFFESGNKKFKEKDFKGAIKDYSKSIEIDPNNLNPFYNRGLARYESYSWGDALKDFEKVLEFDSEIPDAYSLIGSIKCEFMEYQETIKYLDKAIELGEGSIKIYRDLAFAKRELGDHKGALNDTLKWYELDATVEVKELLGKDYFMTGNYQKSMQILDDLIKTIDNPEDYNGDEYYHDLILLRGRVQKELGDLKGACEDWKKAAELGSEDAAELLKEHCQ